MTYKLTYFDLKVLGEPIRFLLLAADQPFEDDRVKGEDWPTKKGELIWGQLPVLTFDGGKQLAQSAAISQFLAQKYGFIPSDEFDKARCLEIVGHIQDCRAKWATLYLEQDPEKREAIRKELLATLFPHYLGNFNKIVAANNGGPYIVGKKVSWADFWLANFVEIWRDTVSPNLLDAYPALQKQMDAVFSIPQIENWIQKRPKSSLFGFIM